MLATSQTLITRTADNAIRRGPPRLAPRRKTARKAALAAGRLGLEALAVERAGHLAVHRLADNALRQVLDCDENYVLVLVVGDERVRRVRRNIDERAGRRVDLLAVDGADQRAAHHQ